MWPYGPRGRRRLRRKLESQSDVAVIIREQISELAGCGIAPVQPAAVVVVNRDEPACRVLDRGGRQLGEVQFDRDAAVVACSGQLGPAGGFGGVPLSSV